MKRKGHVGHNSCKVEDLRVKDFMKLESCPKSYTSVVCSDENKNASNEQFLGSQSRNKSFKMNHVSLDTFMELNSIESKIRYAATSSYGFRDIMGRTLFF